MACDPEAKKSLQEAIDRYSTLCSIAAEKGIDSPEYQEALRKWTVLYQAMQECDDTQACNV